MHWTGKFYSSGDYISIHNYNQNTKIKITGDAGQTAEMTPETENDLGETEYQNENTVLMIYNPTHDNMSEILLVGGTDKSYKSPETCGKAWNHENYY